MLRQFEVSNCVLILHLDFLFVGAHLNFFGDVSLDTE